MSDYLFVLEKETEFPQVMLGSAMKNAKTVYFIDASLPAEAESAIAHASEESIWLAARQLTRVDFKLFMSRGGPLGDMILFHPIAQERIPLLQAFFRRIYPPPKVNKYLPLDELLVSLRSPNAEDRIIGGATDRKASAVVLLRGNLQNIVVPFSFFRTSGDGLKPDFADLGITDYGRTIQLGEYEAATDAILYEFDAHFRARLRNKRRAEDKTFGACLRRLRIHRQLCQSDFEPAISAKEIGRIENGQIRQVRTDTLKLLASRLRVEPDEINRY